MLACVHDQAESVYLEVTYPASYGAVSFCLSGSTFIRIFETTTNCLQHVVIQRGLMGPCWLEMKFPKYVQIPNSFCKVNVSVLSPGL